MKLAIVEDEKVHQDYLVNMLEKASEGLDLTLSLHIFDSAEKFLMTCDDYYFDGILLDIVLDDMNGYKLAEEIRIVNDHVQLAFITGETDYVYKGYNVDACSYLLKPIKQDQINNLLITLNKRMITLDKGILVQTSEGLMNLYQKEIKYIESQNHVTNVYTGKDMITTKNKMKQWDLDLDTKVFFKVHRSYIINLCYVERIEKKNVLVDGTLVPIARGNWESLMKVYMKFRRRDY